MSPIIDKKYIFDRFYIKPGEIPRISVVGAGGKTSVIRALSETLEIRKIRHDIITTTHMWPISVGSFGRQIGSVNGEGKVCPPEPKALAELLRQRRPLLIEADGSKGLPCKAPENFEPVILPQTTHILGVLGASCIGKKLKDCCHRPERVMEILGVDGEHRMTPEDLYELIRSPKGLRKGVEKHHLFYVIMNQVDDKGIYEQVRSLKMLETQEEIDGIWFTCLK